MSSYDLYGAHAGELIKFMHEAGSKILADALAIAQAAGVEVDTMLFDKLGRRLGETVADAAKLSSADLIVVATHGRHGLGRLFIGSGAEQIIRLAPVHVLVVRDTDPE